MKVKMQDITSDMLNMEMLKMIKKKKCMCLSSEQTKQIKSTLMGARR